MDRKDTVEQVISSSGEDYPRLPDGTKDWAPHIHVNLSTNNGVSSEGAGIYGPDDILKSNYVGENSFGLDWAPDVQPKENDSSTLNNLYSFPSNTKYVGSSSRNFGQSYERSRNYGGSRFVPYSPVNSSRSTYIGRSLLNRDWVPDIHPKRNSLWSRNLGLSSGRSCNNSGSQYEHNGPRSNYIGSSLFDKQSFTKYTDKQHGQHCNDIGWQYEHNGSMSSYWGFSSFDKQNFPNYPNKQYGQHGRCDRDEHEVQVMHVICENCSYIRYERNSELYKGLLGRSPYQTEKNEFDVSTSSTNQSENSQRGKNPTQSEKHPMSASHNGHHKRKLEHFMFTDFMNHRKKRMLLNLEVEPVKTFKVYTCRKLLILDLNGLLVDVVDECNSNGRADVIIGRKAVFKRPFCDEFLKFCFDTYAVAIWSSRMKKNVDELVNFLLGDMKDNLVFCWDQSKCTVTGFNTLENRDKPLLLKQLKKVWQQEECDLPWTKGVYSASNTLMMDDSPYKALLNPPRTAVFPHPYSFTDENDCALGPYGDIRLYLEDLLDAGDVQAYVKRKYYAFGQRPITPESPNWTYYRKIIDKLSYYT